jgi:hypothetical protein
MQSGPYQSTLLAALKVAGSAERLATALGVPRAALESWLAGRETAPLSVFMSALDVISRGPSSFSRSSASSHQAQP